MDERDSLGLLFGKPVSNGHYCWIYKVLFRVSEIFNYFPILNSAGNFIDICTLESNKRISNINGDESTIKFSQTPDHDEKKA